MSFGSHFGITIASLKGGNRNNIEELLAILYKVGELRILGKISIKRVQE